MVLLVTVLFAVACKHDVAPKPDKVIDEGKMENILYDVALMQAIKSYNPTLFDKNGVDPKTYIYKKYSIDSLTLAQNHTWYAANLDAYEKMQQRVADRLKAEKEKLEGKGKKASAKKTDSTATSEARQRRQRARMMQHSQQQNNK